MGSHEYPLTSLYLYLSDRCNLRCRHCWVAPQAPEDGDKQAMDLDILKSAISEAKGLGLSAVKLTGGEPFLCKDIIELMRFLHKEGIGIDIESNGTMIDRDMARVIKKCEVRQVSISLDAAQGALHDSLRGSRGCHGKSVAALQYLRDEKINTQVIMSLYAENVREIEALAALCESLAVPSFKINPVMPTGRGEKIFQRGDNLDIEKLIGIDRWIEKDLAAKYQTDIYFCMPVGLKSLHAVTTNSLYECHILNILGILADGTISLCGIGQTETELNMGNIAFHGLTEIWSHHPLLEKLRKETPWQLGGVCGRCIFKFRCLGSCRACAYAASGDLRSPFFMCDEAYNRNLFPASRIYN